MAQRTEKHCGGKVNNWSCLRGEPLVFCFSLQWPLRLQYKILGASTNTSHFLFLSSTHLPLVLKFEIIIYLSLFLNHEQIQQIQGSKLSSSFLRFVFFDERPNIFQSQYIAFMHACWYFAPPFMLKGAVSSHCHSDYSLPAWNKAQRRAPSHFSILPHLIQCYCHANLHTLLHNGSPWWHLTFCDPCTNTSDSLQSESRGVSIVEHLQVNVMMLPSCWYLTLCKQQWFSPNYLS